MPDHFDVGSRRKFAERRLLSPIARPRRSAALIAIDEADVALKPRNLTMEEAASLPLDGPTAWQVLVEQARLKEGQKILIHAGSGGVGTFAIQLAKHLGAEVATTTSKANVDLVKRLGVDVVIDYKSEKFETLLSGYDVALNSLAGDKGVTLFQRTMSRLMREADRS
jgi:NADPH:quinone reductase-like Zn-dependent oxidoreductase